MKAWNDNSVTDTGTAHDGRVTITAPSLSFLCLLLTVLPYLSIFADSKQVFLVAPNVNQKDVVN